MEASADKEDNQLRGGQAKDHWFYADRSAGSRNMVFGIFWIVSGLAIMLYISTELSMGGSYILPILAMTFGLVQFFKGLVLYITYRRH